VELKTVRPGKEFELAITAVPPFASSPIIAPVTIKTSSPKMPTINLTAYVLVQEPVVVVPNQVALAKGPLRAALSRTITIRNNGTNLMALSEASANVPGPEVRVQEVQPGHLFSLGLNFPAGFEIKPDQKVVVSVKSNHPKFPLIEVPVTVFSPIVSPPLRAIPARETSPVAGGK